MNISKAIQCKRMLQMWEANRCSPLLDSQYLAQAEQLRALLALDKEISIFENSREKFQARTLLAFLERRIIENGKRENFEIGTFEELQEVKNFTAPIAARAIQLVDTHIL